MNVIDFSAFKVARVAQPVAAQAQEPARYVPAYCNPSNEVKGEKYEQTKGLPRKELAALIRADIKAAMKAGSLPAGLKVSVKTESYSGGGSIDVKITALPEGFQVWNPEYVVWRQANPHDDFPPFHACDRKSQQFRELVAALEVIHGAYNRDNSDSQCDYFDRRYYGGVDIAWELEDQSRKAEGL